MYRGLLSECLTLCKISSITSKSVVLCPFAALPTCYIRRYTVNVSNMDLVKNDNIFRGVSDRFNGLTIDSSAEPCSSDNFLNKLNDSLTAWSSAGKRAIWFQVNVKDSDWVPILAKNGFKFHHARENFVMMYKWLTSEMCNIPPYAHTNLGVGAVVINENNKVLVVQEKYLNVPHWKLPGGYVEIGEDISEAAMREVKEETGIDTKFHSIVAFRHTHKMMFGNSDIYVITNLIPLSNDIVQCERELVGCRWMDIEEYLNHPDIHFLNKTLIKKALEFKNKGIKFSGAKNTYKMYTMEKEMTIFTLEDD